MRDIGKESNMGYDSFPKIHVFFDSYQGVWVDDEIKKYVSDKSKEIKEFEKKSPMQEPEQTCTNEEREEYMQQEQEDIGSLSPYERYVHDFNQKFGNVQKELLRLIDSNLRNKANKINEK